MVRPSRGAVAEHHAADGGHRLSELGQGLMLRECSVALTRLQPRLLDGGGSSDTMSGFPDGTGSRRHRVDGGWQLEANHHRVGDP